MVRSLGGCDKTLVALDASVKFESALAGYAQHGGRSCRAHGNTVGSLTSHLPTVCRIKHQMVFSNHCYRRRAPTIAEDLLVAVSLGRSGRGPPVLPVVRELLDKVARLGRDGLQCECIDVLACALMAQRRVSCRRA